MTFFETKNTAVITLCKPSNEDLKQLLPAFVVQRILRHLDPATGDASKEEVQCIGIDAVIFNPYTVEVFYNTLRHNGVTGTQFMRFYPFTTAMRCLPVTAATDREPASVVMIKEHRRSRGATVQMLPAGAEKEGRAIDVLLAELLTETGCLPTSVSRAIRIDKTYMDDGIFSDQLELLTIDGLEHPDNHSYFQENIQSIVLVPWKEWKENALNGLYDDIYCTIFAARCELDSEGRIRVNGKKDILRDRFTEKSS